MKCWPLLWAAVWRHPAETLLTWLAASVAFALFGLMVGLQVHTQQVIEQERMDRLYVVMRFPDQPFTGLPSALAGPLARVRGVTGVATVHWLNGYHGDPHDPASVMAVDEGGPRGDPELPMSRAQWARLWATPTGVFASRKAAARWHLRPGDLFQVTTPQDRQADGDATRVFQVLGLIGDLPERDTGFLLGNDHYVDESEPRARRGLGNMFYVAIADPGEANRVCHEIDARFASSGTPTYCVPMRADAQAMANSSVNIAWLTLSVAGAGLFMIFFLIANAIARSVSERLAEFAVLETVGFQVGTLRGLVMLEAALPCLLGALAGTAIAWGLTRLHLSVGPYSRIVTAPEFPPVVLAWSVGFAALLAAGSSVVPLLRLRTLSVVDALAGR